MKDIKEKLPSAIGLANYNYCKDKLPSEKTALDRRVIKIYEEKYPELKL